MPKLCGDWLKLEAQTRILKAQAEIVDLKRALWNQHKELRSSRAGHHYARSKIKELEAKIQRMEEKARELLVYASKSSHG